MAFSHKNAIVEGTHALENWAMQAELSEESWTSFRAALHELNPEVHECKNDACAVHIWHAPVNECPGCGTNGERLGRRVQNGKKSDSPESSDSE